MHWCAVFTQMHCGLQWRHAEAQDLEALQSIQVYHSDYITGSFGE